MTSLLRHCHLYQLANFPRFPRSSLSLLRLASPTFAQSRPHATPRYIHSQAPMATNGTSTAAAVSRDTVEAMAHDFSSPNAPVTNWSRPGPAAYDFRSDVVTTPTASMLASIASTTLLDDVFNEDPTTIGLEHLVSTLTGKPAALLVLSGTMGNQVALRTALAAPPHSILCDHRCHIVQYEAGGAASANGAMVSTLRPVNGHHLTLDEDILPAVVSSDDVHACPTRLIALENSLNGTVLPLSEAQKISAWARAQDPPLHMHLDGARLWEAAAAGAGSLQDYAACFDSISLCFSKGLGAPIGSVLVGEKAFIKRARWVRKLFGGGLRQAGVLAAPARVAVEDTFLGGLLTRSHEMARRVGRTWEALGGKLAEPVETNMVWIDLQAAGVKMEEFVQLGVKHGVRTRGGRLVVHYQISDDAITRLEGLFKEVLGGKVEVTNGGKQHEDVTSEDVKRMKKAVE